MNGRRDDLPGWTFRRFGGQGETARETPEQAILPEETVQAPVPETPAKGGRNMAIRVYDGGKSGDRWVISFTTVIGAEATIADTINRYCRDNDCEPVSTDTAYCDVGLGTLIVTAIVRKKEQA